MADQARYIRRSLEPVLQQAVSEFPAVLLTGPRQSGKTTLLKKIFGSEYAYASLELLDVRQAALSDPRAFFQIYPPPVILDEVQYAPELLPYVKEQIDEQREQAGQFLLTGSQNLLLMQNVTETLAGRVAVFKLLPLSRREAGGDPAAALPWERASHSASAGAKASYIGLWEEFLRGGYPELVRDPDRDFRLWHGSYIQTYLERDVRNVRQVGDLGQFQTFVRLLAARSAQLLDLSRLAGEVGVAVNTIKSWLSVLETTHQVAVVRPYLSNIAKRLVKTPKVYFTDVGTLCYLTGLRDPLHAAQGPMKGEIVETAVFSEIYKTLLHRGEDPEIYFWRTGSGTEVDFIVRHEPQWIPVEAKHTATPLPTMASGIRAFRNRLKKKAGRGFLIHLGDMRLPLGPDVLAMPYTEL